ncbi:MAG: FAD-dependent oxidoreductase [Vicinamibacteria bacterium]
MRIAIIGSGIAGLSCAWMLRHKHEVTLYEADHRFGGHAHSHDISHGGDQLVVDSGFIVFNQRTYPNLIKLFREIGVVSKPSDMSFGVRCRRCRIEYSSRGLRGLFATPSLLASPGHYRLLFDIGRFGRLGKAFLAAPGDSVALKDFLDQGRFSETFKRHFILPMAGAVWSASFDRVLDFDTLAFLRFFDNHGWLTLDGAPQWLTVDGGSRAYVAKLVEDLGPSARRDAPVTAVMRNGTGVTVETSDGRGPETFDQVVLACHANDALRLLKVRTHPEEVALASFGYSTNRTLLHADRDCLPRKRAAWASWNCDLADCHDHLAPVSLTYHMNRLQSIHSDTQYCVTLNPASEPKAKVFAEMSYTHPILDRGAIKAQEQLRLLSGADRVHFAGAHLYNGFHEDGIRSAVDVAQSLGVAF